MTPKNYATTITRRTLGVVICGRDPNSISLLLVTLPSSSRGVVGPPLPDPLLVGGAQAPASKDAREEGMASDDSYSAPAREGDGAHESKREPS